MPQVLIRGARYCARMSQENVEIVRRGYVAFNRGGPEAIMDFLHPEIEWHTPKEDVERKEPYRGHEGVARFWREYTTEFTDVRIEPEEILDGGDCVVVLSLNRARGKLSGLPVEIRDAHLWTHNSDGKATSLRMYLDRQQALEEAGLVGWSETSG
jgi:ketosteroid isomerase-like protein